MYIEELDTNVQTLVSYPTVWANFTPENKTTWQQVSYTFTTGPNTVAVRVGGYAYLVDNYGATLSRAIFDDFELNGPAGPAPTIAQIKQSGGVVQIMGKVVTASFSGFFYIEEADRSSGIKVTGSATAGNLVNVNGTVASVDGETTLVSTSVVSAGPGSVPQRLVLNNLSTNESLSPVGLYVTVFGKVLSVGVGSFTISDGSPAPLKVYGTATLDDYVSVFGALGSEMSGPDVVPVMRSVTVNKLQ